MPMYDRVCTDCESTIIDSLEPISNPDPPTCSKCGGKTERAWLVSAPGVIQDTIEGGYVVYHGICNEDGSPRKYYSKSEMAKAAKEKGLVNAVRHRTAPDSDKAPHTTRWI